MKKAINIMNGLILALALLVPAVATAAQDNQAKAIVIDIQEFDMNHVRRIAAKGYNTVVFYERDVGWKTSKKHTIESLKKSFRKYGMANFEQHFEISDAAPFMLSAGNWSVQKSSDFKLDNYLDKNKRTVAFYVNSEKGERDLYKQYFNESPAISRSDFNAMCVKYAGPKEKRTIVMHHRALMEDGKISQIKVQALAKYNTVYLFDISGEKVNVNAMEATADLVRDMNHNIDVYTEKLSLKGSQFVYKELNHLVPKGSHLLVKEEEYDSYMQNQVLDPSQQVRMTHIAQLVDRVVMYTICNKSVDWSSEENCDEKTEANKTNDINADKHDDALQQHLSSVKYALKFVGITDQDGDPVVLMYVSKATEEFIKNNMDAVRQHIVNDQNKGKFDQLLRELSITQ